VLAHRLSCLVLSAVVTLALGIGCLQLRTDITAEGLLGSRSEAMQVLAEIKHSFGDDKLFQIVVQGEVFSEPFLSRLRSLHGELEGLKVAVEAGRGASVVSEQLISLISIRKMTGKDDTLSAPRLLAPWPTVSELPELRERVLRDRTLVGQVVSSEGTHAVLLLRTKAMSERQAGLVYDAIMHAVQPFEGEGFRVHVGGVHTMEALMSRTLEADMGLMFVLSLLVICGFLSWLFRHPLGVLGPLLVVLAAIVCTVGAMGHAGVAFTGVTSVLTSLLLAVGVGDAIHIQSAYRDALRETDDRDEAIVRAVARSGVPVLLTSLTTAAGLISFRSAELVSVQDMGTFGALGVMAALVSTLVLLPCLLSFHRKGRFGAGEGQRRDLLDRVIALCDRCSRGPDAASSRRRRRLTLALGAALGLVAIVGATSVRPHFDPVATFAPDHPARLSMDTIDRHVGGMGGVVLSVRARPGETLQTLDVLTRLERLEAHILAYRPEGFPEPFVTNVTSVLDPLREVHRALFDDDPAFSRLPTDERGLHDLFTLLESANPEDLSRLWSLDAERALVVVRVRWQEAGAYLPFARHIEAGVRDLVGDAAEVRITGSVFAASEVVGALVQDLIRSFGGALLLISLLMGAMLRSLRLLAVALVPNLLPIVATAGVMGFAGIHLNLNTMLVASIALGIAVDDTIHFLYQFAARRREGAGSEAALAHAFQHSGRAMVGTSLVLAAGFAVFQAAQMVNVGEFGMLVAITVGFALLFDLILTPALLRTLSLSARSASEEASLA
jgi:predicted RND superfamily exporter protein